VGFGFGFGSLGWVPLAPGERFIPWYGAGFYGRPFVTPYIARGSITAMYRNASVTTGISAMRAGEFGRAGVTGSTMVRPTAGEMAHAGAVRGQVPVSPSRESTQFSNRAASPAGMPRTSESTHFAGRSTGSQVSRVSFDQQQRGFTQRSVGGAAGAGGYHGNPAGPGGNQSWQHFDPSARPGGTGAGAANRPAAGSPGAAGRPAPSLNRPSQPQSAPRQASPQQPVRVNPSIVQNRGNSSAPPARGGGGAARGGSRGGKR